MNDKPKADPFATMKPDQKPSARKPTSSKRQASTRWQMYNAFVDTHGRQLTPAAYRVWITLFRDTRCDGLARSSQKYLGDRNDLTTQSIRNAIRELREAKLLTVVRRGQSGVIGIYRVSVPQ